MTTKSEWLAKHLRVSLKSYKEAVGIHPTYSLEAVSFGTARKPFQVYLEKPGTFLCGLLGPSLGPNETRSLCANAQMPGLRGTFIYGRRPPPS